LNEMTIVNLLMYADDMVVLDDDFDELKK
jgi:hypothetical protein